MKKIETLIIAGCSHSFGAETVSEDAPVHPNSINYAYGKFLSEKLGCSYKNISCSGLSNFDISRRIQQEIDFKQYNNETTLVIIGWTDPNRFTFYPKNYISVIEGLFLKEPFPYNFSAYAIDHAKVFPRVGKVLEFIKELKFGNEFLSFFRRKIFETDYFYDLNYLQRIFISTYLKSNGYPYLTFSTLKEKIYKNTFKYEKLLKTKNNLLENADKFNFYDLCYKYGTYRGGHIRVEGHKAFSEILYKTLLERNIL